MQTKGITWYVGLNKALTFLLALVLFSFHTLSAPVSNVVVVATDGATSAEIEIEQAPDVWLTFGLDRVAVFQAKIAGLPLWQYIASAIFIFLSYYLAKLLDFLVWGRLRALTARTKNPFDDILVTLLRGPFKIVTFVILAHLGMRLYSWPSALEIYLSIGLKIVIAISISYVLLNAVDAVIGIWRERTTTPENQEFSRQLLPIIGKFLKVFLLIVVLLVTSQNLGFNVTGLIASLSIGGLAIGLAAQDTLGNLFGAIAILADKPFKVGDRIQLPDVDGIVEGIGFRSTRIRDLNGHLVTVPNKTMGNATITNISLRPTMKTVMNLGLTHETPPEKIEQAAAIVKEVFGALPDTDNLLVSFDKVTDSALNILVVHWWKGTDYPKFLSDLQSSNLELIRRFRAESIKFAFPTRTVYLKQNGSGGKTPIHLPSIPYG